MHADKHISIQEGVCVIFRLEGDHSLPLFSFTYARKSALVLGRKGAQALPFNGRDDYRSSHENTKGLLGAVTKQQEFDDGALLRRR